MRINEIASAEDQIALFKLITDKVWQALGDQQRADAEAKVAQPLKAKLKPSAKNVKTSTHSKAAKPLSFKTTLAKPAQPRQQPNTPFNSAKQSSSTNTPFDSKPQILDADSDDKKKDLNGKDRYS